MVYGRHNGEDKNELLILHFFPKNLKKCLFVLKKITWKVKQVCSASLSNYCFSETLSNARTFSQDKVGITMTVIRGRKLGLIEHTFRKPNTSGTKLERGGTQRER